MNVRRLERRLLLAASAWNLCVAAVTLFGYSPWLRYKGNGLSRAEGSEAAAGYANTLAAVAMSYGFCLAAAAIVSFLVARRMRPVVSRPTMGWVAACTVVSMLCLDLVGALLYLVTLVLYTARNRSLGSQIPDRPAEPVVSSVPHAGRLLARGSARR